jgi:hypothetical protein
MTAVLGIDLGTESRGDNHHENKEVVKELYTAFDRGDARRGRAVNRERDLAPASTVCRSPGHITKHTRETFDISRDGLPFANRSGPKPQTIPLCWVTTRGLSKSKEFFATCDYQTASSEVVE